MPSVAHARVMPRKLRRCLALCSESNKNSGDVSVAGYREAESERSFQRRMTNFIAYSVFMSFAIRMCCGLRLCFVGRVIIRDGLA